MLSFVTLASGSSGNAALVSCGQTHILLDAGISARRITTALRGLGVEPKELSGVLITHEHGDHNDLSRVTQKAGCRVIRAGQALTGGVYRTFQVGDVRVEAVPAGNRNHPMDACVGYLLTADGRTLYHAGDTSWVDAMAGLAGRRLDWALLPIDGIYNMDAAEASRCAWTVAARHSVPIHTDPSYHYNRALAEGFDGPGRLLLEHGESTEL